MQDVENLIKTSLGEIQKLLSGKAVVGDPIAIEGTTLIPLMAIGFGFGAGGIEGKGEGNQKGEGGGGGAGGGAGIKPVAIIIIDKNGSISVEPIRGGLSATLDKMVESVPQMMEKCYSKWKERRKEEEKKES